MPYINRGTGFMIFLMAALITVVATGLVIQHPLLDELPHPLIPWGLIAALTFGILVMIFGNSSTRGGRLRKKAQELELSFTPRKRRFNNTLRDFSILYGNSTRENRLRNIITGSWQGRHVTYFDYTYDTPGDGDIDSMHCKHSGLLIDLPQAELPCFSISPKDNLRKGIEALSLVQKFIGKPESNFDLHYTIKSRKRDRIREQLPDEILLHFEVHVEHCLEVQEDRLLYYVKDAFIKVENFEEFLERGVHIALLIERQFHH